MYKLFIQKNLLKVFLCFLMGIVAYCVYQEWIIISIDYAIQTKKSKSFIPEKKELICFFSKGDQWHIERTQIAWTDDHIHNISTITEQWIALGHTEGFLEKKITLQTATLSPDKKIAYLSFNQSLLAKEQAIHQKLMLIEGLLKTIRGHNLTITHIHFLNNHQPLQDAYLDFTDAWPVDGFIKKDAD